MAKKKKTAKKIKRVKKVKTPKKIKAVKKIVKNPSLEMLATALRMEEKGKAFYEKAVMSCHNDLGREIFSYLMNEEVVHVGRIKKIFANLKSGGGWKEDWKEITIRERDLGYFFKDMAVRHLEVAKADTGDIQALDIGLDFEHKAVEFYSKELPKAKDQIEKDFVEMMVLEEKKHVEILDEMKSYMTDPEGWGAKLDKLSYDGG